MKDELSLLQAQLTYKKRLVMVLKELYDQQRPLEEKVARLKQSMLDEQKDVERLQGHSLAAFFYYVTGQMEEKLDEERRQAYAAQVKYDAAVKELEAIKQDIEATREDLADLANCETRYAEVLEEKRRAIEATATPLSEEFLEKEKYLSFLTGQERELEEAIAAGTTALRLTNEVVTGLKDAENLGLFDLLGGGLLADLAKHETLDEAQKNVEALQVHLQKLNKELADVELPAEMQVTVAGLLQFADVFFDGLFADALVLDNIKQSLAQVDRTRDQLLGILRQLQTRMEEVRHAQVGAKSAVDEMIVAIEL